jgi:hypothetical protein
VKRVRARRYALLLAPLQFYFILGTDTNKYIVSKILLTPLQLLRACAFVYDNQLLVLETSSFAYISSFALLFTLSAVERATLESSSLFTSTAVAIALLIHDA